MIAYTARMSHRPEALVADGRYWVDRIERMFRAGVDQRHLAPAAQSMDVRFDDFMADRARAATRNAIAIWSVLLLVLAALIVLSSEFPR